MAESITLVGLMRQALKQVPVQDLFDRDPYESRRTALKGEKLMQVLTVHQLIKSPYLRGVVTAIDEHHPLQEAVDGPVARKQQFPVASKRLKNGGGGAGVFALC